MKELIVITGSCGRIGTALMKQLGDRYQFVGLELPAVVAKSNDPDLIPIDLSSQESVRAAFETIRSKYGSKIASVIHLAAYYSFCEKHSPLYETITVQGTVKLLEALAGFEVEQFLFSSTMLVHAPGLPGHKINEESPVVPNWDYPLSKVHTEKKIRELKGKMKSVILRIAGVYDDTCHSIPISHQIQRIYESQLESRVFSGNTSHGAAFLHMDDLVDAIQKAVEKRSSLPSETVLCIAEPITYSYDHLQRRIATLLGRKPFYTIRVPKWFARIGAWALGKIPFMPEPFIKPWMVDLADDHYELEVAKAKQVLGWEPRHDIDKTLPKMIDALKKDPAAWYRINGLTPPRRFPS